MTKIDNTKVMIAVFGSTILLAATMMPMASATHKINITEARNLYSGTYEIPGEPSQTNSVAVKYVIGSSSTIKIDVVDDNTGAIIRTTGDLVRSPGTYTWTPSWTWKPTVDSYRVVAYYKSGSSYIKDDEARGFVQADKITQNVGGWTPNEYTRATRTPLGTDYTIFKFRYWYWDNSVYNPDQGTPRLNLLKSRTGEVPGFKGSFVTEFRRAENGFDAGYWNGITCVIYAWNGNLPNPQREIEENACFGQEEFDIFTYDDELMTVVTGSDPTNIDTNNGYFSEVTMFRLSKGSTVNLTMEYELEECTFCGDSFDIVDATKQTEVV